MKALFTVWHLAKREFLSYFRSSLAYVFLTAFVVVSCLFTFKMAAWYKLREADLTLFFQFHPFLFLFFVPAVGMRLWSEEDREGTLELLLTLPMTIWQTVLAKFLAAWAFLGLALLLTVHLPVTAILLGEPDVGKMLAGYAGSLLLGAMAVSLCALASAFTVNQVSAYVGGLAVLLILTLAGAKELGVQPYLERFLPAEWVQTIVFLSVTPHAEGLHRGVIDSRDLVYFGSFTLLGLLCTGVILRCRKAAHRWNRSVAAGMLILGAFCVILLNLLARPLAWRWDLSSEKQYTLTSSTLRLLENLPAQLELRFYFSGSSEAVTLERKAFARRVEDLLKEYVQAAPGKVALKILDPVPGSADEAAARFDGVTAFKAQRPEDEIYCGLSVSCLDEVETLAGFGDELEPELELAVSRLIQHVTHPTRPIVLVNSPLPLSGEPADAAKGIYEDKPAWLLLQELRQDYDLRAMPDEVAVLDPERIALIVLVQSSKLAPKTLYALDQYLMHGGRLLILLDPLSIAEQRTRKGAQLIPRDQLESILGFGKAWGLRMEASRLVADPLLKTPVMSKDDPFMLTLDDVYMSGVKFRHLVLPYAGSLQVESRPGLSATPLIRSSTAAQMAPIQAAADSYGYLQKMSGPGAEQLIGVTLEGTFNSAFERCPDPELAPEHLQTAAKKGRVTVIADVDILYDPFTWETHLRFDGHRERLRLSDNIDYLLALCDRDVFDGDLAELYGKKRYKRQLSGVSEREQQAYQARFGQIAKLQREYGLAAQSGKDLASRLKRGMSLSEEELKQLDDSKLAERRAQDELTRIEAELKGQAKAFEEKVFMANLFSAPLLLLLLFFVHQVRVAWRRRASGVRS